MPTLLCNTTLWRLENAMHLTPLVQMLGSVLRLSRFIVRRLMRGYMGLWRRKVGLNVGQAFICPFLWVSYPSLWTSNRTTGSTHLWMAGQCVDSQIISFWRGHSCSQGPPLPRGASLFRFPSFVSTITCHQKAQSQGKCAGTINSIKPCRGC